MHIHGNSFNVNAANLYSVGNGAQSMAAERAAAVRKKLLKSAAGVGAAETPEETLMIGRWLNSAPEQEEGDGQHQTASSGRDPDFG